ncbi:Alcohol acetyltransferase [Fusarium torreyae]|uniref:Alcohol acetyltransferase n=1 Tax=Fusarium torreyae TaxID=1237075 RepID=A0A9W8RSC7_9HYPO|nr:Alcohol acetyltransferase [Fusarium torreyae]
MGIYVGCAIFCRYKTPEALLNSGSSLESTVEHAFARALLRHPLFTVGRINDESNKPSWVRLDRIDFNNHIEWKTIAESEDYKNILLDVLEWQINSPYTHLDTQPHWRATILKPSDPTFIDIVFAWDHTAGDGKSGKIFHDSLLACLNSQSEGAKTVTLQGRSFEVPTTTITPELTRMVKLPLTLGFVLIQLLRELIGLFYPPDSPHEAKWAPIQIEPGKTRFESITVDKNALRSLLEICRQHQTTLTGLMHALILVSMTTRLPESKAEAFECGTPFCLRQYQSAEENNVDMNKTVINSAAPWGYVFDQDLVAKVRKQINDLKDGPEANRDLEATVWSAAKTLRQELTEKLKHGNQNDEVGLTKFIGDWRSYFKGQTKSRAHSWEISNLGVINGKVAGEEGASGKGGWIIDHAMFASSAVTIGPALLFCPVSVKDKAFTMTCSWQVGVVDDDLAQGVLSDMGTWLSDLGNSGNVNFAADGKPAGGEGRD